MKKKISVVILILCFLLALATFFVTWWRHATSIQRHPFAKAVLTEHFDATGAQCIFYTWETKEGLVVIDGGKGQLSCTSQVVFAKRDDIEMASLAEKFDERVDQAAEIQQAYSDLCDFKAAFQKTDECYSEYKRIAKQLN